LPAGLSVLVGARGRLVQGKKKGTRRGKTKENRTSLDHFRVRSVVADRACWDTMAAELTTARGRGEKKKKNTPNTKKVPKKEKNQEGEKNRDGRKKKEVEKAEK